MNNKHDMIMDEYYCNDCNKKYKTYKTLWKQNKKFHNKNVHECSLNVQNCSLNVQTFLKKSLIK